MANTTPLDDEIDALEAELRTDPKYVRLGQLRQIRKDYLALPGLPELLPKREQVPTNGLHGSHRKPGRRRSPEREQAIQECKKWLTDKALPTRITDIDAHLQAVGIRIGGDDPLNNLSALLSTCGKFQSHGRAGWTLKSE